MDVVLPKLIRRIGLRWPILQAPMAGVSSPAMAAAVSNAGGLGALGIGAASVDQARVMIRETRVATDKPFNVNVFCHRPARSDGSVEAAWVAQMAPLFERFSATPPLELHEIYRSFQAYPDMLEMLLEEHPALVSFHFGLPSTETIAALREAGIVLLASATSLVEAQQVQAAGLDGVVAQGWEAGGHRGTFDPDGLDEKLTALQLTRILVEELDIPVITAGGVMTGADIAAALSAGAVAAQLGTAFIDCPESLADTAYRAALHSSAAEETIMLAEISGRSARCLANGFTNWAAQLGDVQVPDYPIAYDAGKALNAAAKAAGESGYGAQWAGMGAPQARCLPAAKLVEVLVQEMDEALALKN